MLDSQAQHLALFQVSWTALPYHASNQSTDAQTGYVFFSLERKEPKETQIQGDAWGPNAGPQTPAISSPLFRLPAGSLGPCRLLCGFASKDSKHTA